MAFGVYQKASHDISLAFGKGLQRLKVQAMANQGKPNNNQRKGFSRRALVESIMLGIFTITVAAIPVIVTRVPASEPLIIIKNILQDWCTPFICFGVLIVGVLTVTFGGGGSEPAATPEQNHYKFAGSYLTRGPVSAIQIDPLSMPDIFFSADAARTHPLNHSAAFPVRVAQPSSVMVPVYYPAFLPQQPSPFSSHSEKDSEFLLRHGGMFESNGGEKFIPRVDVRFVPQMDGRFSPGSKERFSPTVEERFVPRVVEWYSSKVEDKFGARVEERFSPRVKEIFVPKVDGRYVPRVEERYEPQEQDRFKAEEEDTCESEEEVRYEAHVHSRARSDSEDEGRYSAVEDAESDHEDQVESKHEALHIESDEGEAKPEVEVQSDSEDEVEHYSREFHLQQAPLPSESVDSRKFSPPQSPIAPAVEVAPLHTQLPPSQRQSYNASSTVVPVADASSLLLSSLLLRRRLPTVSTTIVVQKAPVPPPPVSEPVATSSPEPKMLVRVERKEAQEISPRTPPKHANKRRPLFSSSSYAEYVRRTIDCPLPTSKVSSLSARFRLNDAAAVARVVVLPKVGSGSPRTEAVETSLDEKLVTEKARRHSAAGVSLMKETSTSIKRLRDGRVLNDDILDDNELTLDPAEDDDVDQRVETFLKNFREQMRLQRQESLQRHRRGYIDP